VRNLSDFVKRADIPIPQTSFFEHHVVSTTDAVPRNPRSSCFSFLSFSFVREACMEYCRLSMKCNTSSRLGVCHLQTSTHVTAVGLSTQHEDPIRSVIDAFTEADHATLKSQTKVHSIVSGADAAGEHANGLSPPQCTIPDEVVEVRNLSDFVKRADIPIPQTSFFEHHVVSTTDAVPRNPRSSCFSFLSFSFVREACMEYCRLSMKCNTSSRLGVCHLQTSTHVSAVGLSMQHEA